MLTTPAAQAGYPIISVPAGFVFSLPIGMGFIGRAFSEPVLIKLASGFEAVTKARRPPQFLPSVEFPVSHPGPRGRGQKSSREFYETVVRKQRATGR